MTRRRTGHTVGAFAAALLVGAGMVVVTGPPAAAAGGGCPPASAPPSVYAWYDKDGSYRGTRLAHRESSYHLYDDVYDTYGPNYRQVEMWERGGYLPPRRVSCERKPAAPKAQPETPRVTDGGGGYVRVGFPSVGVSIRVFSSPPPKGNVDVGELEVVK